MTTPVRKHLVTVVDAAPAVQAWVDQFIASARAGTGDWPHPHGGIEQTFIPLARFDAVMAEAGWARTAEGTVPMSPVPDPDKGGIYHNVLHSLLGDFH
ncbi:hypothetical protein [Paractinoplanes rishiriensis]|nr:hypothetical protein [Actinoplanes rishiriensis]